MQIPLLGLGLQGRSLNLSAQRRLNLYLEIDPEGDKSKVSAHPTPGLASFVDFGDTPCRGMHAVGDLLYVVHRSTLWEVNNAAVATSRGTLTTSSGRVSMADNGVELFIADGSTKGHVYTIATTTLTAVTDADALSTGTLPQTCDTVTFLDGYFIVSRSGSGQFWFSDGYAGLNWQSTSFATAEANPDALTAVIAERGLLGLFGEFTTEVWANVGTSPVPFARVQGSTQDWGLGARWSLCKFDETVIFLGRNRLGQVSVMRLVGTQAERVSTPDLEYLINGYSNFSDAAGFSYMLNGHPMYQLNFPTVSKSWLYDGKTGAWSELESAGITRHRAELSAQHLGAIRVADYENGKIYTLSPDVYTDNGAEIAREIQGGHVYAAEYNSLFMSELRLDMETGVGLATGQGSNPQVMLAISHDGGHTWGVERWTSAGKIGEYRHRARWRRLGRTRDTVFKIRITDPVKVVLLGAALIAERGSA